MDFSEIKPNYQIYWHKFLKNIWLMLWRKLKKKNQKCQKPNKTKQQTKKQNSQYVYVKTKIDGDV